MRGTKRSRQSEPPAKADIPQSFPARKRQRKLHPSNASTSGPTSNVNSKRVDEVRNILPCILNPEVVLDLPDKDVKRFLSLLGLMKAREELHELEGVPTGEAQDSKLSDTTICDGTASAQIMQRTIPNLPHSSTGSTPLQDPVSSMGTPTADDIIFVCDVHKAIGNKHLAAYRKGQHPSHLCDAVAHYGMALDLCAPGHSSRSTSLNNLGAALSKRYEREGDLADLTAAIAHHREALNIRLPGHPDRWYSLNNLAKALLKRYEREGDLADLTTAIAHHREALDIRLPGHPNRSTSLNNLANALLKRYEREGDLADLTTAIAHHREALDIRLPGHPDRWYSLNNLAKALLTRYEREGDLADLTTAIAHHREALDIRLPGHPNRSTSLNNLANALLKRYEREGDLADLTAAIAHHREALDLYLPGHPDRSSSLNNLANAILKRYEREGDLADLTTGIAYHREAVDLRLPGHPDRSMSLNNIANALLTRYEREGDLADLTTVIAHYREALDLRLPGHPDRSSSLNNLANAILTRYEREGDLADLTTGIAHHREALDIRLPGHPDRSMSLNNLADALLTRYEREGDLADLTTAIARFREALDLDLPGHPGRSMSLNNLATALLTHYKREGDLADLTACIAHHREALDLRLPGHPDRSMSLNNLANALLRCYEREGDLTDLGIADVSYSKSRNLEYTPMNGLETRDGRPRSLKCEILGLLQEAANSGTCSPRACLMAALDWVEVSRNIDPLLALDAYISSLGQLHVVLTLSRSLDQRYDGLISDALLTRTRHLGVGAASCAVRHEKLELAVELLEQGRAVLLAEVGKYRMELDDLHRANQELAKRFHNLSRLLDVSAMSEHGVGEHRSIVDDPIERHRKTFTAWKKAVDEIRTVPNFEKFLTPPSYTELRKAAAEGPIIIIIPHEAGSDALIIQEDAPIHHVLLPHAGKKRLRDLTREFVAAVSPNSSEEGDPEWQCKEALKSLWREVVEPIAEALQKDLAVPIGSRVWWHPTSDASFLPLHAAGLYSKKKPQKNFPDLYVSSYAPTLKALLRSRGVSRRSSTKNKPLISSQPSTPGGEDPLIVRDIREANPSETAALPSSETTSRPRPCTPKNVLIVSQPNTPGEQPLPDSVAEANTVRDILSPTREVTTLLAEAGTCAAVEDQIATHSWIHFSCHGIQRRRQAFDSYLSLHDGHLTLRKLLERKLPNADFAFLSACHSAEGDKNLSDEALHLSSALQFAGFKGVVGSLWAMVDEDGPPLAKAFYEEMVQHGDSCGAAIALHKAVNHLREIGVPVNRWMRFVHIGI